MVIHSLSTMSAVSVAKCFYVTVLFVGFSMSLDYSTPHPYSTGNLSAQSGENVTEMVDFHLTKLLDIRMGGKPEQFKTYIQDVIRKEINNIHNEIGVHTTPDVLPPAIVFPAEEEEVQVIRAERSQESSSPGQETLMVLLDTLSKEIQGLRNSLKDLNDDIRNFLKDLNDDIASMKKNRSISLENKPEKCHSNRIGVNYDPDKVTVVSSPNKTYPKNCKEVQENGYNVSGIYEIRPRKSEKPFVVLCDMETSGGGWTYIQNRFDGSQNFFLEWRDYKFGFGDLEGEFWLGLEKMYLLTGFEVNELMVELVDREKKKATARYAAFGIGPETEGYVLNVLRGFSGDAGDSLVQHYGSKFSTRDLDQDGHSSNCADAYKGGWWYKACHVSNLNGKYINVDLPAAYKFQGMHWLTFRSHEYCHSKSRMLIRPVEK